jgi:hypothetical protein
MIPDESPSSAMMLASKPASSIASQIVVSWKQTKSSISFVNPNAGSELSDYKTRVSIPGN